MSVIGVTTDDVCAGLDEFEASTLRKSDWWYESQAEHLSVWNSTTSLANNSTENQNESLWQAFCNRGIRVILDMHVRDPENFQKVSNFVKDQTAQDFREDWSTLASSAPQPLQPIQGNIFPDRFSTKKMVYTRTFRFSKRAEEFYGPFVENELLEGVHARGGLTLDEFGEFVARLANRHDALVILCSFNNLPNAQAKGTILMIDCIPVAPELLQEITCCANCHKPPPLAPNDAFSKCSRCKQVRYCSRNCQKAHWKIHKPRCQESTTA